MYFKRYPSYLGDLRPIQETRRLSLLPREPPPPHSPAKTRRVGIDVNKRKAYKGPFYTILFVVGNVLNQAMH